jgi:hypothetical protein
MSPVENFALDLDFLLDRYGLSLQIDGSTDRDKYCIYVRHSHLHGNQVVLIDLTSGQNDKEPITMCNNAITTIVMTPPAPADPSDNGGTND